MTTVSTAQAGAPGGVAGIQSDPQQFGSPSGMDPNGVAAKPSKEAGGKTGLSPDELEKEQKVVKQFWKDYDEGRKFDENFRKQIAIDRRYSAGTSDLSWAVTTNLIGAYIDILVALLYARDPDVSVSKSPQVEESGTDQMEAFPRTLQIVISHLWKKGKLKRSARKATRSVLTTGEGWLKAFLVSEVTPNADTYQTELNDARELQAHLTAEKELLEDPTMSPDELEAKQAEVAALMVSLEDKLEVAIAKIFVVDHVPSENMQVSNDVAQVSDYLDANWIGNEKFIKWDDALAQYPRLTENDLKGAKAYYQRGPKELTTRDLDNILPQGTITAETAQAFTGSPNAENSGKFVRSVEQWSRIDKHIRTVIEGVKIWAKEPFTPPYPTSRFYPYFYFSFYEVDAERHPQSLAWRLYKLQDEYSSVRSNFRLMRERSIPAVMFDATAIDDTEAKKLSSAKIQELIALRPTNPGKSLADMFAPKPVGQIDMRMFDTQMILADMERISGVQEALSAAAQSGNPKTATEANIEQSGTNARTGSDRDNEEEMLSELALATAEQALQCLSIRDVQRIAGPAAFWPEGMDIEDLFTMVEVQIEAGTTGKPRQGADQQTWTQLLPVLQQAIKDINQALALGDMPLAAAQTEVIKETMLRLGDTSDPMRFIPKVPPPGSPGSNPPPKPVPAPVSISLRGELDPVIAAMLAKPDLDANQQADVAKRAIMAQASGQSAAGGTPPGPGPGPNAPPQPAGPPGP